MKKENLKKWLIPVIGVVIVVIIAIILAVVLTGKKDGYRVLKVENLSGNVTLERDEKGITEEEFPEVLKGNANLEQLKFVIETMQRCKAGEKENFCEEALWRVYYGEAGSGSYKPISQTAAGYVYDMNELNNMMALMQVENLSADKIPSVCTISGNEVIFKVCDITSPGWIDLTIDNYYMGENNEILVEYTYENTFGSDGMRGVNGKSIAHL